MASEESIESRSTTVFNKSRALVIVGIVSLSMLAWGYMVYLAWYSAADTSALPKPHTHHSTSLLFVFVMWSVMMVAMMLPTAAPTILMYETIAQKKTTSHNRVSLTVIFVAGYLFMWTAYSGLAAFGQLWFQTSSLVSTQMVKSAPVVSGILLISAGIFQFTPLKYACLKHCRSPMGFFIQHWQEGWKGSFLMGLRNGMYCIGCCWALMVLMFVAGVMNTVWMAILALYILVEKLIPWGRSFSQLTGILMIVWGGKMMLGV
jgi:predicted metal-binding membrane protein